MEDLKQELKDLQALTAPTQEQKDRIKEVKKLIIELEKEAKENQDPGTLPKSRTVVCTVADISDLITRESSSFYMINFVDQAGQPFVQPVSSELFTRNQSRFQLDMIVVLTIQTTIAGKTYWVDKTGKKEFHKSSGDSIQNVVKATGRQIATIGREDNLAFITGKLQSTLESIADPTLQGNMAMLLSKLL